MQGLRLDEAYGTPAQVPLHHQLLRLQHQLVQVQQLWLLLLLSLRLLTLRLLELLMGAAVWLGAWGLEGHQGLCWGGRGREQLPAQQPSGRD